MSNLDHPHPFDPSYASTRCVCGRAKDAAIHKSKETPR